MQLIYIVVPLLGAAIGWITNVLAIKFIFRPHNVIVVPILRFKIQGVIPKRRSEIAISIGKVVETELLSIEDLIPHFEDGVNNKDFVNDLIDVINTKIVERLPSFIPQKIANVIGKIIEDILSKELPVILPDLARHSLVSLGKNVHIRSIVEEKINSLELASFEEMIVSITKKELKHIEYIGAVLGFIIGLLQVSIIYFIR